jgi:hypothetical protein
MRSMNTRIPGAVAAVLASLALSSDARALPVTWTFEGTVQQVVSLPSAVTSLGVGVGAQVTGFVRFESTAPDTRPANSISGAYVDSVLQVGVTIGGWSIARGVYAPDPAQTVNDAFVAVYPDLAAEFFQSDMYDPTSSFAPTLWSLELSEHGNAAWPTDALPATPPALSSLDPYGLDPTSALGYGTDMVIFGGGPSSLRASLTSLQRVDFAPPLPVAIPGDVPEPVVSGLLALSALALVGFRR